MLTRETVVLKFGSSVLDGPAGYRRAALEVIRERGAGRRVVAVVSAVAGTTDHLLSTAHEVSPRPRPEALARLLATGEEASALLLELVLGELGVSTVALDTRGLGLRTRGPTLDGEPVEVDLPALRALLDQECVVVVPGFVGSDQSGRPSLLGRGGSDLTALFLAHRLGAACRLLKDVDGLYPADPATHPGLRPFPRATWEQVVELGRELVQEKAVRFAREWGLPFTIAAPGGVGTRVGGGVS